MKSYLRIFVIKNLMQLQTDLAYRVETAFMLLTTTVTLSTTVILYSLLFTQVKTVGDWTLNGLLYLLALGNIAISLYTMFSWGSIYHQFRPAVKSGGLDYFLLKPKSTYFLLSTGRFDFSGLTRFIPSLFLLIYLTVVRPVSPSLLQVIIFLFVCLTGILLLHLTIFTFYSLSFWTTSTDYFHHFAWAVIGATTMPLTVFPEVVYWLFSTVFPVAYASVIPVRLITGLEPISGLFIVKIILVPAIYIFILRTVWSKGLRRYGGASA